MGDEGIAAVADAGPLIHLYEIDRLDLLRLFHAVHIPDLVWQEATHGGRVPEATLRQGPRCRRHPEPATREPENAALGHLHGGERAALQLCARLQISLLLTDDLAAREAAARFGTTPVGSVGIIAKGHLSGLIDFAEAETALSRLYDTSTLFVARALIDQVILALRRHGRPA